MPCRPLRLRDAPVEARRAYGRAHVWSWSRLGTQREMKSKRKELAVDSDRIEGKTKETEGEIQQKWGEAKDKARDAWEDVKDTVEDIGDDADDRVDERDETDYKVAERSASTG